MRTVLWTNTSSKAVYRGGALIQPGETREIPAHLAGTAHSVDLGENVASTEAPVSVEALLSLSLRDMEPRLQQLDKQQLLEAKRLEERQDKPRRSVVDAIDTEILKQSA